MPKATKRWEIVLTSDDLALENPTKEELLDLITASIPLFEISEEINRLAVAVVKIIVYQQSNTILKTEIKEASCSIREYNSRHRGAGVYYSLGELRQILIQRWNAVLARVAEDSNSQWTVSSLKKTVSPSAVWQVIEKMKLDKRLRKGGRSN